MLSMIRIIIEHFFHPDLSQSHTIADPLTPSIKHAF